MTTRRERGEAKKALNLPEPVQTDTLGPIQVRKMSVADVIGTVDTVIAIAMKAWEELQGQSVRLKELRSGEDANPAAQLKAIGTIVQVAATDVLDLLEPATGKKADELSKLDPEELFDVLIVFLDLHQRSIERFFVLRAKLETLVPAETANGPSSKRSTTSSPADGASARS